MPVYEYDPETDSIAPVDLMILMKKGIKPEALDRAMAIAKHHAEAAIGTTGQKKYEMEKQGIPGPPCPHCSHEFYIRTGVCLTCCNCGESSSCG